MAQKRKANQQTLAEVVGEASEPDHVQMEFQSPIRDREVVDDSGVLWRIRGGELRWSRAQRLIRDPAVPVLHAYLEDLSPVPAPARDNLLERIRAWLDGDGANNYTAFVLAEFKDDAHRSMVVIEESC